MITAGRKIFIDTFKDRFSVVSNLDRFSVDRLGCTHDLPAEMLPDRLMSETYSEDRNSIGESLDDLKRDARIIRRSRAGRDQDLFRAKVVLDLVCSHFVVPHDFHLGSELAGILHEVICK